MELTKIIEFQLRDLTILQRFLNGEDWQPDTYQVQLSVASWLRCLDFTPLECIHFLTAFYAFEDLNQEELTGIIANKNISELIAFIAAHLQAPALESERVAGNANDSWDRFLLELAKSGINIKELQLNQQLNPFLNKHLTAVVAALSKLKPGSIQQIKQHTDPRKKVLSILNWLLFIAALLCVLFETYMATASLLTIWIFTLSIGLLLGKKFPDEFIINDYRTFQDIFHAVQSSA
jgi:hypothetical protein